MRLNLVLLTLSALALFCGLPALIELRIADAEWLGWAPPPDDLAWTYAKHGLQLLMAIAHTFPKWHAV